MAMGKIQLKPVITMRIPLKEWREAFDRLEAMKGIKVLMYPNNRYLNQ